MSTLNGIIDTSLLRKPLPLVRLTSVTAMNPRRFLVQPADDDLVTFVPMKAVEEESGRHVVNETKRWGDVKKGYTPFQEGDVIFAKITPCMENGKFAIAKDLYGGRAAGSTEFHVFRPTDQLDARYLLWFLFTQQIRESAKRSMRGGAGQLRVPISFFEEAEIPLPSIEEQREVVGNIETQLSRLEAGVSALKRAQANLKRYRAAVLKAACEGRLVPTEADLARAECRVFETGAQLLARIGTLANEKTSGLNEEQSPSQIGEVPCPVPSGWILTTIGQAFGVYVGATPSRSEPAYWAGQIPWISSGEVAFCRIKDTREKITVQGLSKTSTRLHPRGTVLIGMIGEGKTRGQVAILDIEACNNQNSAAIQVSASGLPPEYVYYYLWGQYESSRRIASGNNQPALNKSRIRAMLLPLPPLEEQQRIVAEVERRLSVADQLELTISASLRRAARLRQSVLQKAFALASEA